MLTDSVIKNKINFDDDGYVLLKAVVSNKIELVKFLTGSNQLGKNSLS